MREKKAKKLLQNVQQTYNEIAKDFSQTRQWIGKEFTLFKPYLQGNLKIVDLGCGNGRLHKFLEQEIPEKNFSYAGIDNSEKLLEEAKKNFPKAKFLYGEMQNIPLPDHDADLLFCIRAFHHLPTKKLRLQALKEMKRVLKPDGKIIVTVWNLWMRKNLKIFVLAFLKHIFSFGMKNFKDVFVPWNNKHLRYYHAFTTRELKKLFQDSGFHVLEFYNRRDAKQNSDYIVIAEKSEKMSDFHHP